MTKKIVTLTDEDFEQKVKEADLILVDFWADWCGPCQQVAPVLEQIAEELDGKLTVAKVNVDENIDVSHTEEIRSIPTLRVYKNGVAVKTILGAKPKAALLKDLADVL